MTLFQKLEVRTIDNEAWRRSLPEQTSQYPKRPKVLDLSRYE
jgi:hypothetical protein